MTMGRDVAKPQNPKERVDRQGMRAPSQTHLDDEVPTHWGPIYNTN